MNWFAWFCVAIVAVKVYYLVTNSNYKQPPGAVFGSILGILLWVLLPFFVGPK